MKIYGKTGNVFLNFSGEIIRGMNFGKIKKSLSKYKFLLRIRTMKKMIQQNLMVKPKMCLS